MKQSALPLLFLLLSSALFAQTVSSDKPFYCNMASAHPIQYFSQFNCRGITFYDASGTIELQYFFNGGYDTFEPFYYPAGNVAQPINAYKSVITGVTEFTQPSASGPGTYAFNWSVLDANGITHTGSASGTWKDFVVCGGRGCYWHAPELLSNSLTINN